MYKKISTSGIVFLLSLTLVVLLSGCLNGSANKAPTSNESNLTNLTSNSVPSDLPSSNTSNSESAAAVESAAAAASSSESQGETLTKTTKEKCYQMLQDLPKTYDPYLQAASPEAEYIYQGLIDEFDEFSQKQAKRNPAVKEFLVRTLLDNPPAISKAEPADPFPEYQMTYFSQWDQRWGFNKYAGEYFGQSGCGPTVMSMVYVSLTGDKSMTPDKMGQFCEQNGFAFDGNGTAWALFSTGAEELGLQSEEIILNESNMAAAVEAGKPLVLIVGPGHFTSGGHFIVIHSVEDGKFILYDPFNISNCYTSFSYEELAPQIEGMWAISK